MTNRTSHRTIRLLASTGILGLALAMAPVGLDLSLDGFKIGPVQAMAKSGSGSDGDNGSDNSGSGSGGGGSDSSGSGGGGSDSSGSGSGGGGSDNSGPGSANSGPGSANSGPGSVNSGRRGGGGGGGNNQDSVRPEIALDLSAADLNDVMAGRKQLIDDLGRVLEVEIELEHGFRTVTAKPHGGDSRRNPGPITSFSLVDAGGAATTPGMPGNDDGTPDQGPGDN